MLPKSPSKKNGSRIACIGAGPASLTVANDLTPLGYEVVILERPKPGGLMRSNIPSFRLPETVLYEEIDYIVDMGVEVRYNSPVDSMKGLLDQGFDAIFVGSGRLAARISISPAGTIRIASTSESTGWNQSHSDTQTRLANACSNWCRQYSHGLLPNVQASWRQGHRSDGASASRLLQGVAVGIGGC